VAPAADGLADIDHHATTRDVKHCKTDSHFERPVADHTYDFARLPLTREAARFAPVAAATSSLGRIATTMTARIGSMILRVTIVGAVLIAIVLLFATPASNFLSSSSGTSGPVSHPQVRPLFSEVATRGCLTANLSEKANHPGESNKGEQQRIFLTSVDGWTMLTAIQTRGGTEGAPRERQSQVGCGVTGFITPRA